MRINEPQELLQTNQIVHFPQLLRLADKWGFEVRRSPGSHCPYYHRDYPDIIGVLTESTNKVASQRELARDAKRAEMRKEEKSKKIQNAFSAVSENRLETVRGKLPAHITAELTQDGTVVLRDVQVPQIGVTLYSSREDRLIENKIHNIIEPAKRAFYIELNRLKMVYDAVAHFDDKGTFTGNITHAVYGADISTYIPAYNDSGDAFNALLDLMERIEEKDVEQAVKKEKLLDKPFLGDIRITFPSQRGERHNRVQVLAPEAKDLRLSFTTFSHQRVAGDGSRARISDDELSFMAWKIGNIERRIAAMAARDQIALHAA